MRTICCFLLLCGGARGAPAVLFQTAPGQFEVAAADAAAAQPVLAAAQAAWLFLTLPLDLPPGFGSPVFVRVVPPGEWREDAPFRAIVETGGVVSLRIRGGDTAREFWRRGMVRALLLRQAIALHGVNPRLAVPFWLERACVDWWQVNTDASQLEALKHRSASLAPPSLEEMLGWRRCGLESPEWSDGAYWLMVFLRAESPGGWAWHDFLSRLLAGEDPTAALAANYRDRFGGETDRAFWWETGWHHHRRLQTLPSLDAGESRALIADAARFVFQRDGADVVVASDKWRELARSGDGRVELLQHAARLRQSAAALHPFYRNAALSLGRLLAAAQSGPEREFAGARAQFDADWRDASTLEVETSRALDALERRQGEAR